MKCCGSRRHNTAVDMDITATAVMVAMEIIMASVVTATSMVRGFNGYDDYASYGDDSDNVGFSG